MKFLRKLLNLYKRFACWIGWHSPSHMWETVESKYGTSREKCPWCGYEGLVDSQGNLF